MKTIYVVRITNYQIAIADLAPNDHPKGPWRISRINVPAQWRGRGFGTELLKQILADADAEEVPLMLEPVATGGLTAHQLEKWYERHGFVKHPLGMFRQPKRSASPRK